MFVSPHRQHSVLDAGFWYRSLDRVWSVRQSVCLSVLVTTVSPAKSAGSIRMPLGQTCVGPCITGTYRRYLANRIERSVRDVAVATITVVATKYYCNDLRHLVQITTNSRNKAYIS